ncbi:M20/M25/M40 family metallo-hydrolase [Kordiimonas pumila]|uniref:M20/M25/M40 family metallo-hydrolase n=1 Tax=Kordiimonas pumila TaxID=2161677 RepID=A0ABV7D8P6_9PROT|nr:M20/M25/M40 family metallo-hydrolase [Kordiimonas pumila]
MNSINRNMIISGIWMFLAACSAEQNSTQNMQESQATTITRPKFAVTTTRAYDTSSIKPYEENHSDIYAHIDANKEAHIKEVQRWLRQPSISASNTGIAEMAEMVRQDFENMGFQEAALVKTDGHPGVWGYYDAGAEKTLMVYMMYDVQPVNPEDWKSPPFEANLIEDEKLGTIIMARGATNQKGPERAFLNAVSSILATQGTLPVNLMITVEGEEELGSPHYPQIIDKYEDRLKTADGVFFPYNSQSPDGTASFMLGVKGILYFEAEAHGGTWGGPQTAEIHSSLKAAVDSPVWRLNKALSSLVSEDGNTILVPGYYDGITPPTEEEMELINSMVKTDETDKLKTAFNVDHFIDNQTGVDVQMELIYTPTLNIDGIWGGYSGPGVKTILPHKATAKLDSRLPLGLDPDISFKLIREHLDAQGYGDITLRKMASYPGSQTSVNTPLVQSFIKVFNKYGASSSINPRIAGSAPFYQFTSRLKLPMVPAGLGFGTGAHAPNEIMLIDPKDGVKAAGLTEIEKAYVDLLFSFAATEE